MLLNEIAICSVRVPLKGFKSPVVSFWGTVAEIRFEGGANSYITTRRRLLFFGVGYSIIELMDDEGKEANLLIALVVPVMIIASLREPNHA